MAKEIIQDPRGFPTRLSSVNNRNAQGRWFELREPQVDEPLYHATSYSEALRNAERLSGEKPGIQILIIACDLVRVEQTEPQG